MTLGPLEYAVIAFDGNQFNGEIAKELQEVIDNRTIRIVDAFFVIKHIDGEVQAFELDNRDDPRFAGFAVNRGRPDGDLHARGRGRHRRDAAREHLGAGRALRAPLGGAPQDRYRRRRAGPW